MTMVMENQSRQYGGMGYDPLYSSSLSAGAPQFSDPWAAHTSSNSAASIYPTSQPMPTSARQESARPTAISMPYSSIPVSAPSLVAGSNYPNAGFGGTDLLSLSEDVSRPFGADHHIATASPASSSYTPPSYPPLNYAQSLHQHQQQQQQHQHHSRKHSADNSRAAQATFSELDSARGMLALNHQNLADLTPRNIYEARGHRGSTDSYGFPSHSSSVSSLSSHSRDYPYYSTPSVAGSVDSATDYSSAASDGGYDSVTANRTLPPPSQLLGANLPPAPQSMMGQFSSKMSSNTQKKHKCKVCDKRFTRPSSLQTHMYSHTGEKPYACDVEGCGRHFSVVSNLRRHKKVHKGEVDHSHSEDED